MYPIIPVLTVLLAALLVLPRPAAPRRRKRRARPCRAGIIQAPVLVVSGRLKDFAPAVGRPGCILELTDGRTTGKYYVPLSPHDVRVRYPGDATVRLTVDGASRPVDGVYETIGNDERLWDLS